MSWMEVDGIGDYLRIRMRVKITLSSDHHLLTKGRLKCPQHESK